MRAGARMWSLVGATMLAAAVLAVVPAAPSHAAGVAVCNAKGVLQRNVGLHQWHVNLAGTCVDNGVVKPVSGDGSSYGFHNDDFCLPVDQNGSLAGVTVFVRLNVGGELVWLAWRIPCSRSGVFGVESVVLTPHPHAQGDGRGVGVVATRLLGQCPGDPAADFTWTFLR